MGGILKIGKYLFALPMAFFGVGHLMNADAMASMAPFGGSIMIYITGIALLAAAVSMLIGKYDKLALLLLGVLLILTALLVHAPGMGAEDEMMKQNSMMQMMKDLALAGGAWAFGLMAKDDSVANRRLAFARLRDKEMVGKLFNELGLRYSGRPGGYTRIMKCGFRSGDSAPMAYIELVDRPEDAEVVEEA